MIDDAIFATEDSNKNSNEECTQIQGNIFSVRTDFETS